MPDRSNPQIRIVLIATLVLAIGPVVQLPSQEVAEDVVLCRMGASAGARAYRGGVWSLVEVDAINQTDEATEAQAVLRFKDDPTLQYGRRVYVPANARLRTSCPVLVPEFAASNFSIDFVTEQTSPPLMSSTRTQRDAVLAPQSRLLSREPVNVGVISNLLTPYPSREDFAYYGAGDENVKAIDQPVYEMLLAAKRSRRMSRRVSTLAPEDLPADPAGIEILDTIAVSTDHIAADPGGIVILRNWVLAGGTLWIPLDRLAPDTVAAVMGDAFRSTIVDRVRLGKLQIQSARPDLNYRRSENLELASPADFVRVIPDESATVLDTVAGWPAAFWQPFGAGRVYFTTLGPDAWMRPTLLTDPAPITPDDFTLFFPREPLRYFAAEILKRRPSEELAAAELQPFLSEQIGYRIIRGRWVASILAGFCSVLAVACLWQYRRGHAEKLLWIAPLIAVAASGIFVALAKATKRAVPSTSATVSRTIFEAGSNTGHEFGLAALYNREVSAARLGATQGGVFFPDMTAMTGRTRRVTWTDEGVWHWEELELPAGVRIAPFKRPMTLSEVVDCQARFGPAGLEGTLVGTPFQNLSDAVIAFPDKPAISVDIAPNGRFVAEPSGQLADGEYVSGSLLSDEQRRRATIYRELFNRERDEPRAQPVLYAWADQAERGFVFPQANQFGSTLLSIPVRIGRSAPGTQVQIPGSFLPYRAIRDPQGNLPTAYGNIMGQWVESSSPALDWIRFQVPQTVLPLRIDRAVIEISVRAPSRSVEILSAAGDELQRVRRFSRPIGNYTAVLDRPEWLSLDETGGFKVAIHVSDDESTASVGALADAPWKIESLQLQITGVVEGESDAE